MWQTLIVQPIFNLLVFIYAILPGHDFGLAIILFTIVIRILLWPLVKRQLHHTRAMRELQPDIKKIRERTKGDKQKEAQLLMELYKEREISPFGSLGILLIQIPILIGLFQALKQLSDDPANLVNLSYEFIHKIGNMPQIIADATQFDQHLFGVIDLSRRAYEGGVIYWPLMVLAVASGVFQYFQSKQLMPDQADSRGLRQILREEAKGKQTDQADINAAMGRNMRYIFPVLTTVLSATFPGSLALYWTTGSIIAVWQQGRILNQDVKEMEPQAKTKAKSTLQTKSKAPNTTSKSRKRKKK